MDGGRAPESRGDPWDRLLYAAVFAASLLFPATADAQPQSLNDREPWRVVLIRSWDSDFPINLARENALRDALLENAPRVVDLYFEEVDPVRFPTTWDEDLAALLKRKYRDKKVDVVIASGREPLDFAARHRDEIWPGAAIVFNGVIEGTLDDWKRPPQTTGVTMVFDVKRTLEVGRALVPAARKVYFVAGTSEFERLFLDYAEREANRVSPPFEAHRIVGLSRRETFERLAEVEPDALVFYLTVLRDANGQFSPPASDMVTRVSASSKAPVLSAVQTQFLRGPVGGAGARLDLHGRAAGQLARNILAGAEADAIAVRALPAAECQLDWNALKRWNIPERNVPSGCAVVNRPVTLLQAYFWPVMLLAALVVLETTLIWALVMQSRRRHQAEADAAMRRAEMAHVARLSMMGALTASIAHEINQPMGAILSNADAAEMMLDQGTLDVSKLREILSDIRAEDLRASEVIRGLRRMLSKRETRAVAINANAEVADALHHLAYDAARREVRIEPEFDSEVPTIMGDPVQVQQVVINLVMNAMDAVAKSPPADRVVRVITRAHGGGVEIAVKDRGPGIASADAARLLESFHTTKEDGMGLGLAIVRAIVEMHGGRVTYESNHPHGAIFRVWIPAIGT